ncbi:MAG: hypothetical protein JTT16_04775 [Candidatus Brockarchaeota archaeon]|nr:hypothetical protein [Candidatus Brockarchaeota archaeon]MBO3768600.1 hypothetical protein [Candidatus Brockarchaeota archaeon]MBO3800977.1 hypothetical protein [Candidatus Brockarchaeota archaeon]
MKKLRASQLIEEGLLIVLALVMIGAVFGVYKSIIGGISNFFKNIVDSIGQIAYELFGWAYP